MATAAKIKPHSKGTIYLADKYNAGCIPLANKNDDSLCTLQLANIEASTITVLDAFPSERCCAFTDILLLRSMCAFCRLCMRNSTLCAITIAMQHSLLLEHPCFTIGSCRFSLCVLCCLNVCFDAWIITEAEGSEAHQAHQSALLCCSACLPTRVRSRLWALQYPAPTGTW